MADENILVVETHSDAELLSIQFERDSRRYSRFFSADEEENG